MPTVTNMITGEKLDWRVNTPGLFKEILINPGMWIMRQPLQILAEILYELGERCADINDPQLNAIMCRLSIYSISDPNSPEYDHDFSEKIINEGKKIKTKIIT